MSKHIYVIERTFPFVRRVRDPKHLLAPAASVLVPKDWVVLPDGRLGYVEHHKTDGNWGVRPVNPDTGEDLPNPSEHWTAEQRQAIPEEVAVHPSKLRKALAHELPAVIRESR